MAFESGAGHARLRWSRRVLIASLIAVATSCATPRPDRTDERVDDAPDEVRVDEAVIEADAPRDEVDESPVQACERGDAQACTRLGYDAEMGQGVPTDISQAIVWYRRACEAGDAAGCFYLGRRHREGLVVPKNLERARELFTKACSGGHTESCDEARDVAHHTVRKVGPMSKVQGKISRSDVFKEINTHLGDIQACYEREAAKAPGLEGKINVSWVIEPDGLVSNVHIVSQTLERPAVDECVMGVIAAMEFVEPVGGSVTVVYPFMFWER